MARVTINLYNLWVEIEHETAYPDQVTDMSSRCLELFNAAIITCKEMKVDIAEYDFDSEDED